MTLRVLLFLTGAMLAISGAVKLRSTSRAGLGLAPLALLELAAAGLLVVAALPGGAASSGARWSVPAGVALLVVSSVHHGLRLKAHRERRSATEAGRLANYVKYVSGGDEST